MEQWRLLLQTGLSRAQSRARIASQQVSNHNTRSSCENASFNYKDTDAMVTSFYSQHQIPMRGHCSFWEWERNCQGWLETPTRRCYAALSSRPAQWLDGRIPALRISCE
ncbi:hypothetical protein KC19_11G088000 [Ceratodon purpureus]|uniref:Uncharacterized protein n=1 Tax=Ceratodon purpureus TaxID=3225 RepID=A0A8T0GEH3_CERPU|nr:hypothetical protein KC19_11G088000 [Ceratodon purpureus]